MRRYTVIAVGRAQGFYAEGIAAYAKRMRPLCAFEVIELAEEAVNEKNASPAVVAAALEKEGARILAAVPKGARLVALCVEGEELPTEALAAMLREAANAGQGSWAFAVGSSHGLAPAVKNAAAQKLSLSAMTLPHQLARLVLAEQIYRAEGILAGTRYHK